MTSVAGTPIQHTERVHVPRRRKRSSLKGRLISRGLFALSAVLVHLPERPLARVAWAVGGVLYRTRPARRRLVRANLERVVTYLVSANMASPEAAAAASDAKQLDRLTRAAFGHYVRSYLEGATLKRYKSAKQLARVMPDDPALADQAFPPGTTGPTIVIGMHFGALEVPALWATARGVPITAPMETVSDPDIQSYFERSRGITGLKVVPMEGAVAKVRAALARHETVALVADRALGGTGARVELFGAPARLPAGPAVLVLETHAPAWVIAARRAGTRYPTRIERVEMAKSGTPKERIAGFMAAQVQAFEHIVADAPEQWWTLFFPIWDDIAFETADDAAPSADATDGND